MSVLTRNIQAFRKKAPHLAINPSIHFLVGDVRSFDYPKGKFDFIIHAAASLNPPNTGNEAMDVFDIIVEGTRRVLEFAGKCKVKKLLLVSSGAVYGRQARQIDRISEDYDGAPDTVDWRSAYAEAKRAAELLAVIKTRQYGFEVKIPRCFAFVGPYQKLDGHFAIGNFIYAGLNGGPIIVKGDGTAIRSYLYAADLMIFLWTILFRGESCLPYNVGSEQEINMSSLAKLISTLPGIETDFVISRMPDIKAKTDRYVPSIKRAREELNLRQSISLKSAILKTVKYIRFKEGGENEQHKNC